MAVMNSKHVPDYDSIHERMEMDNALNNAYIDPSNFAEYITIIDTGHGKTPSKKSMRYISDGVFGLSLRDWYNHRQVLKTSPWSKLYEDEND